MNILPGALFWCLLLLISKAFSFKDFRKHQNVKRQLDEYKRIETTTKHV